MVLPEESPLVGINLHDSRLRRRFDLDVLEVHRGAQKLHPPLAQLRLQAADRLLLRCNRSELLHLQQDRMVALSGTLLAPEPPHIRHAEVLQPAGCRGAGAGALVGVNGHVGGNGFAQAFNDVVVVCGLVFTESDAGLFVQTQRFLCRKQDF